MIYCWALGVWQGGGMQTHLSPQPWAFALPSVRINLFLERLSPGGGERGADPRLLNEFVKQIFSPAI